MSDWRDDAACIGNPHAFEPDSRYGKQDWETPRAICRGCPVRRECLADALEHEVGDEKQRWGMRGGLTPAERAQAAAGSHVALPGPRPLTTWDARCGTLAGDAAHRRRGEMSCEACLRAAREYARATRKSRAKAVAS